jgi:hypothetical protein
LNDLNDVPKMSLNLNPANQQQQQSQTLDSKLGGVTINNHQQQQI